MRRIWIAAVALTLLLCACAQKKSAAPELVLQQVPVGLEQKKVPTAVLPEAEWKLEKISESPVGACWEAPDGQCFWYTTVSGPDPEQAMRELTGFSSERLRPVQGWSFGMAEYRFSWTTENEEGTYLCTGRLHCGEDFCCGLAVCCREDADGETRALCSEVYADYGLYADGGV